MIVSEYWVIQWRQPRQDPADWRDYGRCTGEEAVKAALAEMREVNNGMEWRAVLRSLAEKVEEW